MSITTNLGLFKHDNPTTNTNQFDVEKALNENWDKLDANAGKISSKIQTLENTTNEKDTSLETEIKALKAENTLLKSQIPSATVVGETVHIEDSSNMPCQIMPLGASKQETREGYNKFNIDTITSDYFIYVDSGTLGASTASDTSDYIPVKANTTYTAVLDYDTLTVEGKRAYCLFDSEKKYLTGSEYTSSNKGFTVTPTADSYIRFSYDKNCKNIMFYEGTETKEYEQYGVSPSIEYPSEVESVGDNINEFNIKTITANRSIDSKTGVVGTTTNSSISDYIEVIANKSYTISFEFETLATQDWRGICLFNKDKTYLSGVAYNPSTNKTITITPTQNSYLRFSYDNNCTNIKVVKSTSTGAYSPYGQGSIEIKQANRNQLKVTATSKTVDGITFTVNEDRSILANGMATADVTLLVQELTTYPANDYILSDEANGSDSTYFTRLYSGSSGYNTIAQTIKGAIKYTLDEKTDIRTYIVVKRGVTLNNVIFKPMIRLASDTDTTYIKGQSQTKSLYTQEPFRAIGDVKDRFVKKDGVWYEEHNIEKIVLDGTQVIAKGTASEQTNTIYITVQNPNVGLLAYIVNCMCENLQAYSANHLWSNDVEGIGQSQSQIVLRLSMERATTAAEVKTFLASNPITVYTKRVTPTLIECTPEQVEVLESFNTYKNVTNISSDSMGELEVFYYKDLETLLGGA